MKIKPGYWLLGSAAVDTDTDTHTIMSDCGRAMAHITTLNGRYALVGIVGWLSQKEAMDVYQYLRQWFAITITMPGGWRLECRAAQ